MYFQELSAYFEPKRIGDTMKAKQEKQKLIKIFVNILGQEQRWKSTFLFDLLLVEI